MIKASGTANKSPSKLDNNNNVKIPNIIDIAKETPNLDWYFPFNTFGGMQSIMANTKTATEKNSNKANTVLKRFITAWSCSSVISA